MTTSLTEVVFLKQVLTDLNGLSVNYLLKF